jgi:hypothetical protein
MRRALLFLIFLFAGVAFSAFLALTANPASAMQRNRVSVPATGAANVDEPALVGNYVSQASDTNATPATCGAPAPPAAGTPAAGTNGNVDNAPSAGKPTTFCDNVPITVKPPAGLSVFDSWFLYMEVSWDRSQPGGCPTDPVVGTTPCDDVDVFTYDDRQLDPTTYNDTGDSASADDPEVAKIFQPNLGNYNLVVVNFAGVNRGYHVKAYIKVFKGQTPFELLAPGLNLGGGAAGSPSGSAPGDGSNSASPNNPQPIDYGANGPALETAGIAPDASFADFPIPEDQFAAPAKGPSLLGNLVAAEAKPPKAVSAMVLILTMFLLPLLVVGGGVGWAYKRSRAAFTI